MRSFLYHNSIAMVYFVLYDLRGESVEKLSLFFEIHIKIFNFNFLVSYGFASAGKGKTTFFCLVCFRRFFYNHRVDHGNNHRPYRKYDDSFVNTFTNYTLVGRTNRVGGSEGAGSWWGDLYNQLYFDNTKFDAVAKGMFYLNEKRDVPFSKQRH